MLEDVLEESEGKDVMSGGGNVGGVAVYGGLGLREDEGVLGDEIELVFLSRM